jgi:DNA-binding transcriptional MerR regulator
MSRPPYTLEDLARDFRLTPRTARYYVEKVVPEHHRPGRGRAAEYGQDTWNCFKFIEKAREQDLTLTQIGNVLADLDQAQIDRVAEGGEELTIVPVSSTIHRAPGKPGPRRMERASERIVRHLTEPGPRRAGRNVWEAEMEAMEGPGANYSLEAVFASPKSPAERWQVLYRDEELQITHRGHADSGQREQVRLAAELIKNILKQK